MVRFSFLCFGYPPALFDRCQDWSDYVTSIGTEGVVVVVADRFYTAAISARSVYTIQPCTMSRHFMQSHICV